jgi:hypothetical protein
LPGFLPGKSVRPGRAFGQGNLPWRKGADIHVDSRYAACRPRLTAAQGPRVKQRAILARTLQRSQSRAKPKRRLDPSLATAATDPKRTFWTLLFVPEAAPAKCDVTHQ